MLHANEETMVEILGILHYSVFVGIMIAAILVISQLSVIVPPLPGNF